MLKYNLEKLGWYQFEKLVQSLLKAELGIGIECWGGHKDYGRDAFFKGRLRYPTKEIINEGNFIFQVKFSADPYSRSKLDNLKASIKKWLNTSSFRINLKSSNNFYTLITNLPLTSSERIAIKQYIQKKLNLVENQVIVQDGSDICSLLDKHKDIRWAYPQLLGIQDIEKLINNELFERSKIIIEEAKEASNIFVPNKAYRRALEILRKYYFAVFEGPPEVGKTITAQIILLNKVLDGWEAYDCRDPRDFFSVYNPEKKQIFFADDAFGSTEYRPDLTDEWSKQLHKILRKLNKHHWFIWTSRSHILKIALERMHLQDKAERFPYPGDVIVDISDFSFEEKALILYRHAEIANLEKLAKILVKKYWKKVIKNPYFTPLRAKRFINETIPKVLQEKKKMENIDLSSLIESEIQNPTRYMKQAYNNLPLEHKKFLLAMLDSNFGDKFFDSGISVNELQKSFYRHCSSTRISFEDIKTQLDLAFIKIHNNNKIDWLHPSVRDLVIDTLKENLNDRLKFIENCGWEGIFLFLSRIENKCLSLLSDCESWESLLERIKFLLENTFDLSLLSRLFEFLSNIIERNIVIEKVFLSKLFSLTLRKYKETIENYNLLTNLSVSLIKSSVEYFYQFLPYIYPERPHLDWRILWKFLIESAKKELKTNWVIWQRLNYIQAIFDISQILEKKDPLILDILEFPVCIKEIFQETLKYIQEEARYELVDVSNYDLLASEADGWADTAKFLHKTKKFFPDLSHQIEELVNLCKKNAERYEILAEECNHSDHYDYKDYKDYLYNSNNIDEDLEKLFDDL